LFGRIDALHFATRLRLLANNRPQKMGRGPGLLKFESSVDTEALHNFSLCVKFQELYAGHSIYIAFLEKFLPLDHDKPF
jgi:hypothetical protein